MDRHRRRFDGLVMEVKTRVNLTAHDREREVPTNPENETPKERVLRVLREAEEREAAGLPRENFGCRFFVDAVGYAGESFKDAWALAWDVVNVFEPVARPPYPMSIEGANKMLAKRKLVQDRLRSEFCNTMIEGNRLDPRCQDTRAGWPEQPPVIQEWIDGERFPP